MRLNNKIADWVVLGLTVVVLAFGLGCGGGGGSSVVPPSDEYDYTTTFREVASQDVNASSGGTVEVTDSTSYIPGTKLTIPAGALPFDTTVKIREVNNPPELPEGFNYIGMPIDLGPDGTILNSPATLEIPYSDADLSNAGISDDTALRLFCYNESLGVWEEVTIISIDTVNNKIIASINHFSIIAKTGRSGTPDEDLGNPQPGDLLFKTGSIFGDFLSNFWMPGHVGIYVGEKVDDNGKSYNVIEALKDGVTRSYYNSISTFARSDIYMGAREPKDTILTPKERQDIVNFVEAQVGKPYAWGQTIGVLFGMLEGPAVKGDLNSFNCVGLAEAAYESARVNNGEGLINLIDEVHYDWEKSTTGETMDALTPAEMYNATKPAGGSNPAPKIERGRLTPDSGTPDTWVVAEICVSHPYGLSYIDSVIYITDDGYTNPNININDDGVDGDITADDGIYTAAAYAGGDPEWGSMGLNFTVTDKYGYTDTIRLVFTYTGLGSTSQLSPQQQKTPSFY